jgi:hypothetical protein
MLKSGLLVKLILTLLLLPGMVWLGRVGLADFMRLAPTSYIDALNNKSAVLDPVELDRARAQLKLAQSWDDRNPIMPEYLGQTDFMLARLMSFSPQLQATFLHNAIVNIDAAIALRPYSAYLWAARMTMGSWLLDINAYLGVVDSNRRSELSLVATALRRADVLDPWNPFVLQQIVKVGAARYNEFSADDRKIFDGAVMRAKQLNVKM